MLKKYYTTLGSSEKRLEQGISSHTQTHFPIYSQCSIANIRKNIRHSPMTIHRKRQVQSVKSKKEERYKIEMNTYLMYLERKSMLGMIKL